MQVSENKITRSYQQEDIQQILQIAIARQCDSKDTEFTHEQLLEIAAELEISPECLQAAEQEWLTKQGDMQKRQAFNNYRRGKLRKHFGNYLIANSSLVGLNFLTLGGLSWSLYILLFWSIGLGLQAWNTYQPNDEDYERAYQSWYRKYQIKQTFNNLFNKFMKV